MWTRYFQSIPCPEICAKSLCTQKKLLWPFKRRMKLANVELTICWSIEYWKKTKPTMDTFLKSLTQSSEHWGRTSYQSWTHLLLLAAVLREEEEGLSVLWVQIILHPLSILYPSDYHLHQQLSVLWVSNNPSSLFHSSFF